MPSTAVTTEDEYLTSTLRKFVEARKNMADRPLRFLDELESSCKKSEDEGERIQVDFESERHSQGQRLSTGYEPITVVGKKVGHPGFDDYADVVYPIVISTKEKRKNRGMAKRIDILERRAKSSLQQGREDFQQAALQGAVAPWADLNTFNGFDDTTGFLEDNAVGAQTNTMHGVARGSYSTLPGWQNQVYDVAGAFSTNGLLALNQVTHIIDELGSEKLKGFHSILFGEHLKRASYTYERFMSKDGWDGGKLIGFWNGIPLQALANNFGLPTAGATTTADPISCIILDMANIDLLVSKDDQGELWFRTGEYQRAANQLVDWCAIQTVAQIINHYLGSHAAIYDANVW